MKPNPAAPQLALVMIARNEARCIARCLNSVRPHVDEMWVLDTGSADRTPELARQAGAQVVQAAWTDDFSAARNIALSLTRARWRLVLDADEWLASGGSALRAWCAAQGPAGASLGLVQVVSEFIDAQGGVQQAPSWLPRVVPAGVGYVGRIHEQPVFSGARQRLNIIVGHDGYRPEQAAAKQGRNRRLLQRALAEAPEDAYWQYQWGKDLELAGQFAQALPAYAQALQHCEVQAGWRHDLLLRYLFVLKKRGQHARAVLLAETEMARWAHSPDFFFTLGDVLLDWAASEPPRAADLLPMAQASWLQALDIGEQPGLQDTVSGRGSWLAAHNLAVLHAGLGQADEAEDWRQRATQMRADLARPQALHRRIASGAARLT